jgi:hypothetical protein
VLYDDGEAEDFDFDDPDVFLEPKPYQPVGLLPSASPLGTGPTTATNGVRLVRLCLDTS